jgi:hypothetical protein
MNGNILPSTPPSAPPNKRPRLSTPIATRFPSFEEEPHSSPGKIGELGLHVFLSPKNRDPLKERKIEVGRALTFSSENSQTSDKEDITSNDIVLHQDDPRDNTSMYVTAFNTAVDTVIEREGHLFSREELEIIDIYRKLPCTSSYISANF